MRLDDGQSLGVRSEFTGVQPERDAGAVNTGTSKRAVRGDEATRVAARAVAGEVATGDGARLTAMAETVTVRFRGGAAEGAERWGAGNRVVGHRALGAVHAIAPCTAGALASAGKTRAV
jgi:hypothetical protein